MNRRTRQRTRECPTDQRGVTLIEMLITLAISGLVLAPVFGWMILSASQQQDAISRNSETSGLGLVTRYLQRDIVGAATAETEAQPGGVGALNCMGRPADTAHVVLTTSDGAPRRIVYSTAADHEPKAEPGSIAIWRSVCADADGSATTSIRLLGDLSDVIANCPASDGGGEDNACGTVQIAVTTADGKRAVAVGSRRVDSASALSAKPVARFTHTPYRPQRSQAVEFSAATSSDPRGGTLSYNWNFGDGTTGTGVAPVHTFAGSATTATEYTIELKVTATGPVDMTPRASRPSRVTISVIPNRPVPVIIPPAGIYRAEAATFTANLAAGDAPVTSYTWDWGDGTAVQTVDCAGPCPTTVSATKTYPTIGVRTVTLTVVSSAGSATTRAVINVSRRNPVIDTVTITPVAPIVIRRGSPVSVQVRATASAGTIASYTVKWGDGTEASGNTACTVVGAPCDFTANKSGYSTVGSKTITITVTDDIGSTTTTTRTIQVWSNVPSPTFSLTPTTGSAPLTVTAAATGGAADAADVASWNWHVRGFGDQIQVGTPTGVSTSLANMAAGKYEVQLVITTHDNQTATSGWKSFQATGSPAKPGPVTLTGSGCCNTFGNFSWPAVLGAEAYEIHMNAFFGGGCLIGYSATVGVGVATGSPPQATGTVTGGALCLGSRYDVTVRARNGGVWGPWSDSVRVRL